MLQGISKKGGFETTMTTSKKTENIKPQEKEKRE
jgi:hypothetical protein